MRILFVALLVVLGVGCRQADASAQVTPPSGETAVLSWSAFECSIYADMAERPAKEERRLFQLGYDSGKRFVEAANRGLISGDEIRSKVPIGMTMRSGGPTVDFMIGRFYEGVWEEAHDRIVKRDASGLPLPGGKWDRDPKIMKIKSEDEYRKRNCALLK